MSKTLAVLWFVLFIQDPGPTRNPWAGFPDGSWALIESVDTQGKETTILRQKFIVRIETGGRVACLITQQDDAGDKPIRPRRSVHVPGVLVTELVGTASKTASEKFQVGDRSIACERSDYELKDGDLDVRVTAWRTKELKIPYRELKRGMGRDLALDPDIVRLDLTLKRGADSETCSIKVVELDHKLAVDGKDLSCVVEEGTVDVKKGTRAYKGSVRRWLSNAVPGRVLRSEVRGEADGKKVERIERVISFRGPP